AKLGMVLFHPWMPARMSSSISLARRSAALRSANPVDSRNSRPLIIFRKYQMPPRFRKAIRFPLSHPAIQRLAIEPDPAAVADEWQLAAVDPVVDRMHVSCRGTSRPS